MPRSFIISNLNNAICHLCGRVRLEAYQTKSERPSIDGFMSEQTNYAPRTFFCSPVFSINKPILQLRFCCYIKSILIVPLVPTPLLQRRDKRKNGVEWSEQPALILSPTLPVLVGQETNQYKKQNESPYFSTNKIKDFHHFLTKETKRVPSPVNHFYPHTHMLHSVSSFCHHFSL